MKAGALLRNLPRAIGVLVLLWPFVPPVLRHFGAAGAADAIGWPWSLTCHRIPARTLRVLGELMPMCSRCAGIDLGMGLGLVIGAPYRGPKWMWAWVLGALALLMVELVTQEMGIHPVWHVTRLLTGGLVAYPVGAAITAIASRPRGTTPGADRVS